MTYMLPKHTRRGSLSLSLLFQKRGHTKIKKVLTQKLGKKDDQKKQKKAREVVFWCGCCCIKFYEHHRFKIICTVS